MLRPERSPSPFRSPKDRRLLRRSARARRRDHRDRARSRRTAGAWVDVSVLRFSTRLTGERTLQPPTGASSPTPGVSIARAPGDYLVVVVPATGAGRTWWTAGARRHPRISTVDVQRALQSAGGARGHRRRIISLARINYAGLSSRHGRRQCRNGALDLARSAPASMCDAAGADRASDRRGERAGARPSNHTDVESDWSQASLLLERCSAVSFGRKRSRR